MALSRPWKTKSHVGGNDGFKATVFEKIKTLKRQNQFLTCNTATKSVQNAVAAGRKFHPSQICWYLVSTIDAHPQGTLTIHMPCISAGILYTFHKCNTGILRFAFAVSVRKHRRMLAHRARMNYLQRIPNAQVLRRRACLRLWVPFSCNVCT